MGLLNRILFAFVLCAMTARGAAFITVDGDSLTYGYGLSPASSNWVGQLAAKYSSITFSNHAINGKRWETAWDPHMVDSSTTNALNLHLVDSPRTAIFWCGVNDVAGGNSFAATTNLIGSWIASVRAFDSGVKIAGCTILKYRGMTGGQDTIRQQLNTWITNGQAACDYTVDLAAVPELNDPENETYFQDGDGVHTTIAGNGKVMAAVEAVLLANNRFGGTNYYVRKDGNNSNAGTANTSGGAWLTIQKAADIMTAGDTVTVGDGTYAEDVVMVNNGTSVSPITFKAATLHGASVKCFYVAKSNIIVRGFTILSSSTVYSAGMENRVGGNYLTVTSNHFLGSAASQAQLTIFGASGGTVGLRVEHNRFQDPYYQCVTLAGGGNHVVTNNYFTGTNGGDLFVFVEATNITVTGNSVSNWNSMPVPETSGLKVGIGYYFESTNGTMDWSNVGAGSPPYGIGEAYVFTATNTTPTSWGNPSVYNGNHPDFFQSFSAGMTAPCANVVIERNLFINPAALMTLSAVQIGNLTDDGSVGLLKDWTIRNNVFARITRTCNLRASGFRWMNNTFFQCATNGPGGNQAHAISGETTGAGTTTNTTIFNNIFYQCGFADNPSYGWYETPTPTKDLADYNLVVGNGAGATKDATWTSSGRETHGINGSDPLFVDAANNDFRLQTNSPAIGAGTNLNSYFTMDISGNVRGTSWAMGAYQETGSSPAPAAGRVGTVRAGIVIVK